MRKTIRIAALLLALPLLLACLALPAGASFESDYKGYTGEWAGGGRSPIKMKLEGDTLTFDYSPVFYFDAGFGLTESDQAEIIVDCVAGFKNWEGIYEIGGRALTVVVDVHPTATGSKSGSSVSILPDNALGSMVPGCLLWRPTSSLLTMYLRSNYPRTTYFERSAMHEFGHVLGLFDAYGYGAQHWRLGFIDFSWLGEWLLPEAPLDRAPNYTVMRSGWQITPTEIEMLLWAWKNNRLQLYTKSALTWLGAQVSPAFSD